MALPGLHNLYAKYKDQGFELIPIILGEAWYDRLLRNNKPMFEYDAANFLKEDMKLTCTIGVDEGMKYSRTYGWRAKDDRILLGRDGKMIAYMDQLPNKPEEIEEVIKKALAAK